MPEPAPVIAATLFSKLFIMLSKYSVLNIVFTLKRHAEGSSTLVLRSQGAILVNVQKLQP